MIRCTRGQLQDFVGSAFWQDVCDEIDVWLKEIRDQLENLDLGFSHRSLDQLGGSAKALRNVKQLPETLIQLIDQEDENEEGDVSP